MKDKDSKITHPPSLIEMVLCEYTALLLLLFPSCSAQFPLPLPPSSPQHIHTHTHIELMDYILPTSGIFTLCIF